MFKNPVFFLLLFSGLSITVIFILISREPFETIILKEEGVVQQKGTLQTLSNDFLDQAVFKRKSQIKSCLRDRKVRGFLKIEMKVLNSGSNRIRFIESNIKHKGTIQCILVLLEKIKFPSFKGRPLLRTYPIEFI